MLNGYKYLYINYLIFKLEDNRESHYLNIFDKEILKEIKLIFELPFGKKIFNMKERLEDINDFLGYMSSITTEKKRMFEELLYEENETFQTIKNIKNLKEVLKNRSNLFKYLILLFMVSKISADLCGAEQIENGDFKFTVNDLEFVIKNLEIKNGQYEINKLLEINYDKLQDSEFQKLDEKNVIDILNIFSKVIIKLLENIFYLVSTTELKKKIKNFLVKDIKLLEYNFENLQNDMLDLHNEIKNELNKI